MSIRFLFLGRSAAWALAFVAGCSGRTASSPSDDAGADAQAYETSDGTACIDISTSSYQTSCHTAADCVVVTTGHLCPGACFCGGATINASGQAAYEQATQGLGNGGCPCPSGPEPECISGTCTLCYGGPNDPAGCEASPDAGTDAMDGGLPDGCISVVPTAKDLACTSAADCATVATGTVCQGECACAGGSPVNMTAAAQIEQIEAPYLSSIGCPCAPPNFTLGCVNSVCTECPLGGGGPAGCPGG